MNQQFYIAVNGQQTGPFSLDDLKTKNIQRDTLIWTEGLDSWTKAEHVALLKDILRATPPPLPNTETKTTSQQVTPPPVIPPAPTGKYFGYELARRRERFFATIIEFIVLAIPYLILEALFVSEMDSDDKQLGGFLFGLLTSAFLGAILYPKWSGNLGHKIMGLKVISSVDGSDTNRGTTGAIREVLKSLFFFVIIPVAWLLWDDNRQNLYDKVVKTYVVKKK